MKQFYYNFWVPFTVTKKRILILAIASYIAGDYFPEIGMAGF